VDINRGAFRLFTSTFGCPFTSPLIWPICDSRVRNAVTAAVTGSSTKWLRASLAACTFRCSRAIVGECYRPFHESFVSLVLIKNLSNRFQHSPNCCCHRVYVLRCQDPIANVAVAVIRTPTDTRRWRVSTCHGHGQLGVHDHTELSRRVDCLRCRNRERILYWLSRF